jgi:hypothetical protein
VIVERLEEPQQLSTGLSSEILTSFGAFVQCAAEKGYARPAAQVMTTLDTTTFGTIGLHASTGTLRLRAYKQSDLSYSMTFLPR